MPQPIVRQIEEKVVKKLKEQAGQHGVSMEEEHRRILRAALVCKRHFLHKFNRVLVGSRSAGLRRKPNCYELL
jgi:plasmid stability protein